MKENSKQWRNEKEKNFYQNKSEDKKIEWANGEMVDLRRQTNWNVIVCHREICRRLCTTVHYAPKSNVKVMRKVRANPLANFQTTAATPILKVSVVFWSLLTT